MGLPLCTTLDPTRYIQCLRVSMRTVCLSGGDARTYSVGMSAEGFGSVPLTLLAASFYFSFTEVRGNGVRMYRICFAVDFVFRNRNSIYFMTRFFRLYTDASRRYS